MYIYVLYNFGRNKPQGATNRGGFFNVVDGFCYFIIISSRRGEMLELNQLVSFSSDSPSQDFA